MKQLLILVAACMPFLLNAQQQQTQKQIEQATSVVAPLQPGEFSYDAVGRKLYFKSNIEENGTSFFGEKYCHRLWSKSIYLCELPKTRCNRLNKS